MTTEPAFEPWDGYEDEDDEDALIRRLELKVDESRDRYDRAYAQAIKLIGETPEIMNNQGFSYILRSDYRRARAILLAAQAKAPNNPHIAH